MRLFTDNDSLGGKLLHLRVFLDDGLKMSGKEGIQPLNLAQTKFNLERTKSNGGGFSRFLVLGVVLNLHT